MVQIYKKKVKKDTAEANFSLFSFHFSLFFVPLQPLFRVTDGGKSRVARLCCVGTIQQHYYFNSKMDLIKVAEEAFATGKQFPEFKAGDTITVAYKIIEGSKERIQLYRGVVIKINGHQDKKRFTVRKMSGTVGVERIFPIESPNIESIEVNKVGKVRRAKLYYLRKLTGKAARIKEKRSAIKAE